MTFSLGYFLLFLLAAVVGLPLITIGPPLLLAWLYRLVLVHIKWDPRRIKRVFLIQYAIMQVAWIIFLLLYFGVR